MDGSTPHTTTDVNDPSVNKDYGQSETFYVKMEGGENSAKSSDDDDHFTIAPSIVSSIMTAEEVSDTKGFAVVCWVVFLADMSRGVVFPTLWPLVESLGGTEVELGYAVAAYSLGRAVIAPIFGNWSVSYGYTNTLLISCAILLVGTFLYAQSPNVGSPAFVVFAQTLLGVGSSTLGVSRAYTAEVTAQRARTTYLAWLSAVQYIGFACTPLIGSILTRVFENEDRVVKAGFFLLNAYTAPGYFLSLFVAITIVIILTYFKDRRRESGRKGPKSKKRVAVEAIANSKTFFGMSTHNACILGCMFLNIVVKGCISCFETLGVRIAQSNFGLTSSRAGTIVALCGAVGVGELLSMGYITKVLTDIQMIIGGMVTMMAGMICLTGLSDDADNPAWRYVFAMFMIYAIGYSISQVAVLGLFSKIVGRIPQGELMGWFSVVGAGSRVVYPLMAGYVVYYRDIGTLCIILIVTLGVACAYLATNRRTLLTLSR